ncbi:beta-glucan synthesis-associated protein [Mucidula mucida]|nr:beta-glucan synthesis-associated protein [Mucidula mucida]
MSSAHRRVASMQRKASDASLSSSAAHFATLESPPASISGHTSTMEHDSPYSVASRSQLSKTTSISSKYSLHADPRTWGSNLSPQFVEPDDVLHNPTVKGGKVVDDMELTWSKRGVANLGCLAILCIGLLTLFVGYPAISFNQRMRNQSAGKQLGINATGQVPVIIGNFALIDADTPEEARTKTSFKDGEEWVLVFSDEFNTDGRTFWPERIHIGSQAVTTGGGHLIVTLEEKETHDLHYQGGLIQTWNKFCFTGGYIEASVQLPGVSNIVGLWPAVWTMGNLGRAGFGASLEGMWPYSYDACDVGTAPNQTIKGQPEVALTSGYEDAKFAISYLPGQNCRDARVLARAIRDPFTLITPTSGVVHQKSISLRRRRSPHGQVSQSGQFAPFNEGYVWDNTTDNLIIFDEEISIFNTYIGGKTQQAASVVTNTDPNCYQLGGTGCFSVYGFEYKPGFDGAYIEWVSDNKPAWRLEGAGMGPDSGTEVSTRPIPQEPMYILVNLGMSTNFGTVDLEHLTFPAVMLVDYIRVYQDPKNINVGCEPPDFPTQDYINTYIEAYTNPNLTTWRDDYHQTFPKNSLVDGCD